MLAILNVFFISPIVFEAQGNQGTNINNLTVQPEDPRAFTTLWEQLKVKGLDEIQIQQELKKIIENPIDPVDQKIQELKAQGIADSEIVKELRKINIYWNPETNVKSAGIVEPDEENLYVIAKRAQQNTNKIMPPDLEMTPKLDIGEWYTNQTNAVLHSNSEAYRGIYVQMRPGGCTIASGETGNNYRTMHLGYQGMWIEVGIRREQTGWTFFTWDSQHENAWMDHNTFLGYAPTTTAFHYFAIYTTGVYNSSGNPQYGIDIDGIRVRTDFLATTSMINSVDFSAEFFTEPHQWPTHNTCVWTDNNYPTIFRDPYVKTSSDTWAIWNNNNVPSYSWRDFAKHMKADDSSGSYYVEMWSGFGDQFYDNAIATSRWSELEVNGATANEYSEAMRVYVPAGGSGWAQAGYVTNSMYYMYDAQVEITSNDWNELQECCLSIGLTKVTSSDPYSQQNWYRIYKDRNTGCAYAQKCLNGQITTAGLGYRPMIGSMMISVDGDVIKFFIQGNQVHSWNYELSSYNCYIYAYTSTNRGGSFYGTDVFNTIEYHLIRPSQSI